MKLSNQQMLALSQAILQEWKAADIIHLKDDDKVILEEMVTLLKQDFQREAELDKEVNRMLEDLERQHGGTFERHKMYSLLKQKLAKERKVIL